ncbi:MAG: GGDEF domain-containing protein [Marinicella sp.]|nr:GGDEF domain-containing protein [Xanthomonadales bacterium]
MGTSISQTLNDIFIEADQNKAINSDKFNQAIEEIQKRSAELSIFQTEFLNYLITFNHISAGHYEDAIYELEELQKNAQSAKVKIRSLLSLSNIYAFIKQYENAFTRLNYVTENLETINNQEVKQVAYLAMANTYLLTNQYQLSEKFSSLLLDQNPNPKIKCRANNYRLSALLKYSPGLVDKKVDIDQAITQCIESEQNIVADFLRAAWINYRLNSFEAESDLSEIQRYRVQLENSLTSSSDTQLKSYELIAKSLLARSNFKLGAFEEASNYALAVLQEKTVIGDNEPKLDVLLVLQSIAEQQGDYQTAYNYQSQLVNIKEDLIQDKQMKELAFLNVKHANQARELEIEQLNKSNQILKIEQQLAKQNAFNQQLVVLLLLIVLGFAVAWLYRMNKRHGALVKVAELDHLTKVYNRSGFEKKVNQWLNKAKHHQTQLHFAIIDFDHFKQINDKYGHLTGDWVLKHVIYEIKKHMDEGMMLSRLGGEEFSLVILEQSSQQAELKMEKIRQVIENLDLSESGHEINITCSFGVTSSEVSGYNLVSLLTHADVALYQAKSAGRNQLIRYQT